VNALWLAGIERPDPFPDGLNEGLKLVDTDGDRESFQVCFRAFQKIFR
jgi:hypothetical protein